MESDGPGWSHPPLCASNSAGALLPPRSPRRRRSLPRVPDQPPLMGAIVTAQIHYHTHHHLHNSLADMDNQATTNQQQMPFPSSPIMPQAPQFFPNSPPHFSNPTSHEPYPPSPSSLVQDIVAFDYSIDHHSHDLPPSQEINVDCDSGGQHRLEKDNFQFTHDRPLLAQMYEQQGYHDRLPMSIAHNLPPSLMLELPSAESSRRTRCRSWQWSIEHQSCNLSSSGLSHSSESLQISNLHVSSRCSASPAASASVSHITASPPASPPLLQTQLLAPRPNRWFCYSYVEKKHLRWYLSY